MKRGPVKLHMKRLRSNQWMLRSAVAMVVEETTPGEYIVQYPKIKKKQREGKKEGR